MGFFASAFDNKMKNRLAVVKEGTEKLMQSAAEIDGEVGAEGEKSLVQAAQADLREFAIYVSMADNEVEEEEIKVINELFGCQWTVEDFAGVKRMSHMAIPKSFGILSELAEAGKLREARRFGLDLINVYTQLGEIVAESDSQFEKEERANLKTYIKMLKAIEKTL